MPPQKDIWPWIIQIGYKRAGFYSYDRLDNSGIHSSDELLPEYQGLNLGDQIPMTDKVNAQVTELNPYHSFVITFQPWAWAWGLNETASGQTRLVTRVYYRNDGLLYAFAVNTFEVFMMRKCLLGIRGRIEANAG